MKKLQRSNN